MRFEQVEYKTRENWYRMPEREKERFETPFPVRTLITFSRYITRCGYFWQPMDCPIKVQNEMALHTMCYRMDIYEEEAKELVMKMRRYRTSYTWPPVRFDFNRQYRPLHDLYYKARGEWARQQNLHQLPNNELTSRSLRTFWYLDLEEKKDSPILARKMRMVGHAIPGSPPSSGWWGSDEGEGPSFEEQNRQLLYEIYHPVPSFGWSKCFVHPLDAEEIKQ